jgi:alpha-tubulin suppressor-like RCC1 family protein
MHSCALRTDGTLWCWGRDTVGQLGTGTIGHLSPAQGGSVTTWTRPAAGSQHVCSPRTDGTLWCWGYNANGQLGLGGGGTRFSPVQVGTATNWA